MLGATVLGAMAADLSEYPSPMYIKDGKFDGLIVIGADADTQDMLGLLRLYADAPDGWITEAQAAGRLRLCLQGRAPKL